jgi:hypothetical protein
MSDAETVLRLRAGHSKWPTGNRPRLDGRRRDQRGR